MADYQRILSYLYRYEKNEKRECKGFVKAEQRRSGLKLTIQINDDRLMKDMTLKIYFYEKGDLTSPAKWPLHYFDELTSSAHQEETILFYGLERLPAGFEIQKQYGVLFYYQDSFYYGSVWIGEELPSGVLIGIRSQFQGKEKEGNAEEPSKEKSSEKDISRKEASQQEKHEEIVFGENAVIRDGDLRKRGKEVKEEGNKEGSKEVHNKKEELGSDKKDSFNREKSENERGNKKTLKQVNLGNQDRENVRANGVYRDTVKIQNGEKENRRQNSDSRENEKIENSKSDTSRSNSTGETMIKIENAKPERRKTEEQALEREEAAGKRIEKEESQKLNSMGSDSLNLDNKIKEKKEENLAEEGFVSTKKKDLLEEMWIKLHKKAPEVDNIFNKAFRKGYRVSVEQLRAFSVEAERLAGNQFLLKGYGHYHHLLAGKVMYGGEERYCVGVPGIYENREKYMAEIYRFPVFLSLTENRIKTGGFGYWLHLLP